MGHSTHVCLPLCEEDMSHLLHKQDQLWSNQSQGGHRAVVCAMKLALSPITHCQGPVAHLAEL